MKNKIILIIFIVISFLLGGYIIYDKVNDNKNTKNEFPQINVEILSMDEPTIGLDWPNEKMRVTGNINLSFDEDIYDVVVLTGYCLGEQNEKYNIHGPGSGAISFHNSDKEYILVNTITQNGDIIYPDGTSKDSNDVDWSTVKIKSCKIEKAIAYFFDSTTTIETEVNYEKTF